MLFERQKGNQAQEELFVGRLRGKQGIFIPSSNRNAETRWESNSIRMHYSTVKATHGPLLGLFFVSLVVSWFTSSWTLLYGIYSFLFKSIQSTQTWTLCFLMFQTHIHVDSIREIRDRIREYRRQSPFFSSSFMLSISISSSRTLIYCYRNRSTTESTLYLIPVSWSLSGRIKERHDKKGRSLQGRHTKDPWIWFHSRLIIIMKWEGLWSLFCPPLTTRINQRWMDYGHWEWLLYQYFILLPTILITTQDFFIIAELPRI